MFWCDNQGSIALANNPMFHAHTKHIELDVHFICEKVLNHQLSIQHVPSLEQVTDIFTKPLLVPYFQHLLSKLHITSLSRLNGIKYPCKKKVESGSSINALEKSTFNLKRHVKGMPSTLLAADYMQQQNHVKPTSRKFKEGVVCVG